MLPSDGDVPFHRDITKYGVAEESNLPRPGLDALTGFKTGESLVLACFLSDPKTT